MADQGACSEAGEREPGVCHQWRDWLWKNNTGVLYYTCVSLLLFTIILYNITCKPVYNVVVHSIAGFISGGGAGGAFAPHGDCICPLKIAAMCLPPLERNPEINPA